MKKKNKLLKKPSMGQTPLDGHSETIFLSFIFTGIEFSIDFLKEDVENQQTSKLNL